MTLTTVRSLLSVILSIFFYFFFGDLRTEKPETPNPWIFPMFFYMISHIQSDVAWLSLAMWSNWSFLMDNKNWPEIVSYFAAIHGELRAPPERTIATAFFTLFQSFTWPTNNMQLGTLAASIGTLVPLKWYYFSPSCVYIVLFPYSFFLKSYEPYHN
jgi:hypothetical protein